MIPPRTYLETSFVSKRIWLSLLFMFAVVASALPQTKVAPARSVPGTDSLLQEAGALRHLKVLRPVRSGTKSRSEIEAIVIKDFGESSSPAEIEAQRKMLVAFGLIAPDFKYREFIISLLTEQVAGFYQARSKEFFLADWNDASLAKPIMIHELTHALQDQHFDLSRFEKWPPGDGDRELAIHALIEGDATAVMFDYLLKPSGLDIARLPVSIASLSETMSNDLSKDREKVLASAPAAIRESLLFPYTAGCGFVQELIRREQWEGVSRAYHDLPQSTEQILHIEKYTSREMPITILPANVTSVLGSGWRKLAEEINGEFGYSLILGEYLTKADARKAAAGWGGDRAVLYENAKGDLLVVHLSEWDSPSEAQEFFEAYSSRLSKRFSSLSEKANQPGVRMFSDARSQASIELRTNRVLVLEGLPLSWRGDLNRLTAVLWK